MVSENDDEEIEADPEESNDENEDKDEDPDLVDADEPPIDGENGEDSLDQENDELATALDEAWDDEKDVDMEDLGDVESQEGDEVETMEDVGDVESQEGDEVETMEDMGDIESQEGNEVETMEDMGDIESQEGDEVETTEITGEGDFFEAEDDQEMMDASDGESSGSDDAGASSLKEKEESAEDYENTFIKSQIEAVLFVKSQGVTAEEINVKLGIRKSLVEQLLDELAFDYLDRSTSLEIAKVGEKYVLQLKPEFTSYVKKFASGGLIREAVMRTLTIVAAKQPILQSQLTKLRSSAGEHLKEMEELGLIRREPKGRSKVIVTTNKFADMFGFSRDISKMKEQIKVFLMQDSGDEE
ncbi:MAG: SMC-Scp complex subunit ScpB [Candidatus Hodarchaeota archaeon]